MDTPEFELRKEAFLKEYKELTEKHQVDVASMPSYFPIGGGAFATMMVKEVIDLTKLPTESPYTNEAA